LRGAALGLFRQHGFGGVSLAQIAGAAGTQPSQVAYHYGSKQGLFIEAACRAALEVAQEVEVAGADAQTPTGYADAIVHAAANSADLALFAEAMLMVHRDPQHLALVSTTLGRLHDQGEKAVRRTLAARGWTTTASPRVEAESFWSLMIGLSLEHLVTTREDRLAESAARLIMLIHLPGNR
jgi:AcrR family transcriptional regulator